jgi:hypothetical protein
MREQLSFFSLQIGIVLAKFIQGLGGLLQLDIGGARPKFIVELEWR